MMAVALAGLQITTVLAPPDPANAASTNDIIRGGIGGTNHPQATMLHYYDNNGDIKAIMNRFGIYRKDIENTSHGTMNSSNHKIKSLGRNPHSSLDEKYVINGKTYYLRPLYTWGDNITYKVIEGRRAVDGKYFAIMINCGNLAITDETPSPPVRDEVVRPTPKPTPQTSTPQAAPVKTLPQSTPQTAPTKTTPTGTTTPPPTKTLPPTTPPPVENLSPSISTRKTGTLTRLDGTTIDANGATAQPGETVSYTVTVTNSGNATESNFVIRDNVQDILEYADITDTGGGVLADGIITWSPTDIETGASLVVNFVAKIKSPLPTAPASISDPRSFDLRIDNIYERTTVSTNLAAPNVAKQVEVASANLPQTGAGSTSAIVLIFLTAAAFFFFRNRQLIKEVSILRSDHGGPR